MIALGLDVGDRRVGLSVSDETGTVARPYGVYHRRGDEADLAELATVASALEAEVLVVGLPLNMDGSSGSQAQKAQALGHALADRVGLPVAFMDERLTSVEAERVLVEAGVEGRRRRKLQDALAAVLILQAWLDRRAGTS